MSEEEEEFEAWTQRGSQRAKPAEQVEAIKPAELTKPVKPQVETEEEEITVPLLDPDLGKDTFIESIDETEAEGDHGWADKLPEWNPRSRDYGIYQQGLIGAIVGHKGGGKSRTMQHLCLYYKDYIDRATCVSTTDVKSGQFSDTGLIHPTQINTKPSLKDLEYFRQGRRHEMELWREAKNKGQEYRQRSYLYLFDDAAYASEVLSKRTSTMIDLFTNNRHMAFHGYLALQSMGFLNKQLRLNVDLVFIVREHQGEAMAAIYEGLFKHNTPIAPWVFREMMDEVCIKGERVMVWDARWGRMFKWTLDKQIHLQRPLGNRAWLAMGDRNMKKEDKEQSASKQLAREVRERYSAEVTPAKGRKKN